MALDDSRLKILRAGLARARRDKVTVALDVSLQAAAEDAGLTTGTAYKIWSSQAAYRSELAQFALQEVGRNTPQTLEVASTALVATKASQSEVIRILSQVDLDAFLNNPDIRLNYLLMGAAAMNETLAAAAAEIYDTQNAALEELYVRLFDHFNLELRPEYNIADLALALTSIADGFILGSLIRGDVGERRIMRQPTPDTPPQDWYLFSCVIESVVAGFTQQRED
jgi:AcrR family transcriptional regulator